MSDTIDGMIKGLFMAQTEFTEEEIKDMQRTIIKCAEIGNELKLEVRALKEENKRLRDLLGKTSACISYMNRDVQGVAEEYLGFWPDDIQAEAEALLKEE